MNYCIPKDNTSFISYEKSNHNNKISLLKTNTNFKIMNKRNILSKQILNYSIFNKVIASGSSKRKLEYQLKLWNKQLKLQVSCCPSK